MDKKKIFYLHVGKTAGTSMNKYIASHFAPHESEVHIENDPHWSSGNKAYFQSKSFLSGHVSFVRFLQTFPGDDYYKFGTFRKPIDHVISHLAWVRHLSDPGKESFLKGHPVWVQEISDKLSKIDFSEPEQISHFVNNLTDLECALFDNSQTRYLLAIPGSQLVNEAKKTEAVENLQQLDFAGITELYNETIAILSHDMGWEMPLHGERLNKAATKYGLDASRPEIRQALKPLIWSDNIIYQLAKEKCLKRIDGLLKPNAKMSENENISVRASLNKVTSKILAGWVIVENNPDAAIYLNVLINNEKSFYVKADKLREDVKAKGVHPTGLCGFKLFFPENADINPGDSVVVTIMGQKDRLFGNSIVIKEEE